jgi:hypothetical protein
MGLDIAASRIVPIQGHPGQFKAKSLSVTKSRRILPKESQSRAGVHRFSKKSRSHFQISDTRRVTWSAFHTEDTLMLCVTVQLGPCHGGTARPQVADRGTASSCGG